MAIALSKAGAINNPGIASYIVIAVSLTAGTAMLMWIGEMITERGIGNGISLIIFCGIVARIPTQISNVGQELTGGLIGFLNVILLIAVILVVIVAVVAMNEGQRRVPVQYAKRLVGRRMYGGQSTFLPLKVNAGGVIQTSLRCHCVCSLLRLGLGCHPHQGTISLSIIILTLAVFFTT
jgi:preprotein translocase subunit SecY